jgi:integrase
MMPRVEQRKGRKDRFAMLSPQLLELLRDWWRIARRSLWFPYDICRALISISYCPKSMFRTSMPWRGVMLSFALVGRVRTIRAAVANLRRAVIDALTDSYRPEVHYMRGCGPKWRQKHPASTRPGEGCGRISTRPAPPRPAAPRVT